jgi:hypothetical protein
MHKSYWSCVFLSILFLTSSLIASNPPLAIAQYSFDETSYDGTDGEIKDSIGDIDGDGVNNPTILKTDFILCSSCSFYPENSYITLGKTFNNIFGITNQNFTITAWIKPDTTSKLSTIITKDNFSLKILQSDKLRATIKLNSGESNLYLSSNATLRDGQWHFIALSYDGSASPSLKLYVDNQEFIDDKNITGSLKDATTKRLLLGDRSYDGYIDEVKIFDLTLQHNEIDQIYSNEKNSLTYQGELPNCSTGSTQKTAGYFDALERARDPNNSFNDLNLTTQIVSKNIDFDIILYKTDSQNNADRSQLETEHNASVGVFVSEIKDNETKPIKFIGEYQDFDQNNGKIQLESFTIDKAYRVTTISFYSCDDINSNWRECWSYNNEPNQPILTQLQNAKRSTSSDTFAIRAKSFHIVIPNGEYLKAQDNNISYFAFDQNNLPTQNYNESFNNLTITATIQDSDKISNCQTTTLSLNENNNFINGALDSSIKLKDVGKFSIQLKERDGFEFAIVDADDGVANDNRFIDSAELNITVLPHHFEISQIPNINHNKDGNFTYLAKASSLDEMASVIKLKITAKNDLNTTTSNYTSRCYANDINLDINFTTTLGVVNEMIYYLLKDKDDNNITLANYQTPSADKLIVKNSDKIDKMIFSDDINGTAELEVRFNFSRETDTPKNPFSININNINISDTSTSLSVDTIDPAVDLNTTFVYGRVAGPKRAAFTNCINTPNNCLSTTNSPRVIFQIYKDESGSQVTALNGATHDGTQDSRWWSSPYHNFNNNSQDGNISTPLNPLITEIDNNHITQNSIIKESNFRYRIDLKYDGANGYIKEGHLKHYPSPWLIYNKNNPLDKFNRFNFNFIKEGWSGKNDETATTKTNTADNKSKKIIW